MFNCETSHVYVYTDNALLSDTEFASLTERVDNTTNDINILNQKVDQLTERVHQLESARESYMNQENMERPSDLPQSFPSRYTVFSKRAGKKKVHTLTIPRQFKRSDLSNMSMLYIICSFNVFR